MEDLQAHPWLSGNIFQIKPKNTETIEEIKEETKVEQKQIGKKLKGPIQKPPSRSFVRKT